MSIQVAAKLGYLMRTNIEGIGGLSALTVTILKRAGLRYAGEVRDALVYDGKIPGVGEGRRLEIARALALHGSWPVDTNGHNYSHTFVALSGYAMGFADGNTEAERTAMNQLLSFKIVNDLTIVAMKDRVLAAYARSKPFVDFRIAIKHDVRGIGTMKAECVIGVGVDTINEMLRCWNPAQREAVKGEAMVHFGGAPSRIGEIKMFFEPGEGFILLKPPSERPVDRFAEKCATVRF